MRDLTQPPPGSMMPLKTWQTLSERYRAEHWETHERMENKRKPDKPVIGTGSARKQRDDHGNKLGKDNYSTKAGLAWLRKNGWTIEAQEHTVRFRNPHTGGWQTRLRDVGASRLKADAIAVKGHETGYFQFGNPNSRTSHRRAFDIAGGVEECKRLGRLYCYLEFSRDGELVLEERWA